MADDITKVKIAIDTTSFDNEAEVRASLQILQDKLTEIVNKNPLVANITVSVDSGFTSVIQGVQSQLESIATNHIVALTANNAELLNSIAEAKIGLTDIKNMANVPIRIDTKQLDGAITAIVNNLNKQFEGIGKTKDFQEFHATLNQINDVTRQSSKAFTTIEDAEKRIVKAATEGGHAVGTLRAAVGNLQKSFLAYTDVNTFEQLQQGAENVAVVLEKLSTKLKGSRVNLVGQLDITQTAKAIQQQFNIVTHELVTAYPNKRLGIVGTLDAKRTAAQISEVINNSLATEMSKYSDSIKIGENGLNIITAKSSATELKEYTVRFQQLLMAVENVKNVDFSALVSRWNASLQGLNINSQTDEIERLGKALQLLSGAFAEINKKYKSKTQFKNGEVAQNVSGTASEIANTIQSSPLLDITPQQIEAALNRAIATVDGSQLSSIQLDVSISSITNTINRAVDGLDSKKLHKVPLKAELVGLTEAINEALTSTNTADSNGTGIPLAFDATGIRAAVNAEIEAFNNNPGALQKIKLEFDTSDLTTVVEEGTKAIDALQKAAQKAAPKNGGGSQSNTKANNELRAFRIQNQVDDAKNIRSLMSKSEINALKNAGVDVAPYNDLEKAIKRVSEALQRAQKKTTEKDKADVLNGVTMKKNIELMKRAEKAAKAFYNSYFNIDTTVDETRVNNVIQGAQKEYDKITPSALAAFQANNVNIDKYSKLGNAIQDVRSELDRATTATTQKDKADILNGETMKNNILVLQEASKEFKTFYKDNSSFFDAQFDSNKYKQAAQAYADAKEMASKWGLDDNNNPLSKIGFDGQSADGDNTVAKKLEKQAQTVKAAIDNYKDILAKDDKDRDEAEVLKLNQELDLAVKKLVDMQKAAKALGEVDFSHLTSDFADTYDARFSKIQNQLNVFQGYQNDSGFDNDDIKKLGSYKKTLTDTLNTWNEFKNNVASMSAEDAENILGSISKNMDLLDVYIAKIQAARTGYANQAKEQNKIQQEQARINDYVEKYESRIKKFPKLWEEIQRIQQAIINGQGTSASFKEDIDDVIMTSRALGIETENIFTKIWERIGFNFRSMVASQGIMFVTSSLRGLYNNVKDLDAAMTELKKVTDGSASTYLKFLDEASNRAQKLGASLVDVVSATSDFARLGYSISDASMLSDAATIYLNVGDDVADIDQATKSIISTMQGFGIETSKVMNIVDEFNEVSNKYASSAGDIGEITRRSAAAMKAAGGTLEETIALGVTANTVAQDADTVGTALKTMSMRLRSSKSDLEAAGEDTEGMADSVSKLRGEILALSGVDIMLDEDTFKSPYQMLIEIGKAWDKLTDVTQANITELLFGKRQANIGSAILQNVDLAESILKTAGNSTGSALKENEVYLSSIQGKLSKIQATWESLSNHTLDSDLVKGLLDGANTLLKVLDAIVDNLGLIPPLIGVGVTALTKHTGKNMPPYREIEKQALGCWWPSSRQCETSKSWNQLKLADLGGAGNGRRVTNIIYYSGQVGKPGKNMRDEVC